MRSNGGRWDISWGILCQGRVERWLLSSGTVILLVSDNCPVLLVIGWCSSLLSSSRVLLLLPLLLLLVLLLSRRGGSGGSRGLPGHVAGLSPLRSLDVDLDVDPEGVESGGHKAANILEIILGSREESCGPSSLGCTVSLGMSLLGSLLSGLH